MKKYSVLLLLVFLSFSVSAQIAGEWTKCIAWSNNAAYNIINGQNSKDSCFKLAKKCTNNPNVDATYYSNPIIINAPYQRCNAILASRPSTGKRLKISRIQNCEVIRLNELGYGSGNKHNFCLSKGWSGGQIPSGDSGNCFRATMNTPATDCPRLNLYYHKTDGYSCEHLTNQDARILKVCGK